MLTRRTGGIIRTPPAAKEGGEPLGSLAGSRGDFRDRQPIEPVEASMRTLALLFALLMLVGPTTAALADDKDRDKDRNDKFATRLSGFNEVIFNAGNAAATPPVPPFLRGAISTPGSGKFQAKIDDKDEKITYQLSFQDLTGAVTQAHIHFGQRHTPGGIVVWLCQTAAAPAPATVAATTPFCSADPMATAGKVEGTITPGQVLTVTGQGIDAGEFDELVRAIRAGVTYANVHSAPFPQGEIRGQIHHDHGHDR